MPIEHDSTLVSLFIEALRQGQLTHETHPLWFRVASGSMRPLFNKDDAIQIESVSADDIHSGEIVAFETPDGLLVHRLLHCEQRDGTRHFLQSGDGALQPLWLTAANVVGRVVAIRPAHRAGEYITLHSRLARWGGEAIASVRYQLYLHETQPIFKQCLRVCSRILCDLYRWYLAHYCTQSELMTLSKRKL